MDHEALEECGRKLERAGDDLETAGGGLECLGEFTAARVGDYGVADAAGNFFASWRDERLLNVEALHELADKVRRSAANYRDTDHAVAGSLTRQRW
ncbi:WXG100 family type VII secretion target [Kitasatospora phosalacinea]|uniref:WXG100 family type VII secretion target n=1 Tax=Kitasatospora phosalacinea TaxID=2065 RepID=A0ABW6GMR9_9ACTN